MLLTQSFFSGLWEKPWSLLSSPWALHTSFSHFDTDSNPSKSCLPASTAEVAAALFLERETLASLSQPTCCFQEVSFSRPASWAHLAHCAGSTLHSVQVCLRHFSGPSLSNEDNLMALSQWKIPLLWNWSALNYMCVFPFPTDAFLQYKASINQSQAAPSHCYLSSSTCL